MGQNETFEFKDGFQGILTAVPAQEVPLNAFVEMHNCFVLNTKLRKRKPFYSIGNYPTGLSTWAACGIDFKPTSSSLKLVYINGQTVHVYNPVTNSFDLSFTANSLCRHPHWVKSGFYLYTTFGDTFGSKIYQNLSGNIINKPLGLPKPATIGVSGSAGGGSWSGTIQVEYKMTWVIDNTLEFVEGNSSDKTAFTVAGTNYNYVFTRPVVPTGYDHITHWRLYRRNVTTNSEFQLILTCAISANSCVDWGDLMVPALNDVAPLLDHAQPPEQPMCMTEHVTRIWFGADSGKLYYSKVNSPTGSNQYFSSLGYFQVGSASDKFVKLISFPQYLLVVKEQSMWIVSGTDVSSFDCQQISKEGSLAPDMTFVHEGYLYFANLSGVKKTTLYDVPVSITEAIKPEFESVKSGLATSNYSRFWSVAKDYENNFLIFCFRKDTNSPALVYYFNSTANQFIGSIEINATSVFTLEETVTRTFGLFAKKNFTYYKPWFNADELTTLCTYTEPSFDVSAITGMLIPEPHTKIQKRLFRFLHVYSYPISPNEDSEQISLILSLFNGTVVSKLIYIGTSQLQIIKLGVSSELLGFQFDKVGSGSDKQWEIGLSKIEFENIGYY